MNNAINDNLRYLQRRTEDFLRKIKRFRILTPNRHNTPMVLALVDGRNYHGGFTDRLKGIVSLFHFALANNVDFRLSYTFPLELSHYLEPNDYDWRIGTNDIPCNFFDTSFANLVGDATINRMCRLSLHKPLIAYANRDVVQLLNNFYHTNYSWSELYHRLFRPSAELQSVIDNHRNTLGNDYISAHFRFVGMFGDFNEMPYSHITNRQKEHIMQSNIEFLQHLALERADRKIFVASDSSRFIDNVKNIKNVYVLSGNIQHIDNRMASAHDEAFMRLLLDFYLIAHSNEVYSVGTDEMYRSELPMYAAKLFDVPFQRVVL